MATYKTPARTRGLGLASLIFGILGLATWWWTPFGVVLSLAGLLIGFAGWVVASRNASNLRLMVIGTLVSLAVLVLDLIVAANGWEIIRFTALR
jgi:hypothetical protein